MRYNPAGKIDVPFIPDYLFPGGLQTLLLFQIFHLSCI